jgi:hypothetical protein
MTKYDWNFDENGTAVITLNGSPVFKIKCGSMSGVAATRNCYTLNNGGTAEAICKAV